MALLYLGYFSTTVGAAAFSVAAPDMQESFLAINAIVINNMTILGQLAALVGKLVCAVAIDSLNGKAAFVGCLVLSAAACVGFAMSGQVAIFSLFWVACQLARSGAWPSAAKLVRGWFLPAQFGPAIAILGAASYMGDAASGHLLSLLLSDDTMDWQVIFVVAAAAMAAPTLAIAALMPGKAPPSRLLPLDMFGSGAPDVVAEKEIAKLRGWAWSRSSRFKVAAGAGVGVTPKAASLPPPLHESTDVSSGPGQSTPQKIIVKGHGQLRFVRQVSHRSTGSDVDSSSSNNASPGQYSVGGPTEPTRGAVASVDPPMSSGSTLHGPAIASSSHRGSMASSVGGPLLFHGGGVIGAAVDKAEETGHGRGGIDERRVLVESNAHYTADERERVELLLHPLTGLTLWDVLVVISRSPTMWCACLASAALRPLMDLWVFAPIYFEKRLSLSTTQAATCASFLPASAAAALILGGTFYSRLPLRARAASITAGLAASSLLLLSLALYPDTLDPDTSVARLALAVFLTSVPDGIPLTEFALQFGGPPRCGLIISLIDTAGQAASVAFLVVAGQMAESGTWTVLAYVTCSLSFGSLLFVGLFSHLTGGFSATGPCLTGDLYSSTRSDPPMALSSSSSSLPGPRRPDT